MQDNLCYPAAPAKNWRISLIGAKFYCPHALADGNERIWIREKMLEFSSVMLPAPSPYLCKLTKIH